MCVIIYMKSLRTIIIFFAAIVGLALTSCIEDDFTTSSSDVLEFSTDTLAFDTVLTEEGTATRRFMVYNRLNAWGEGRELPVFAKESFNDLWKKNKVK